MGYSLVDIFGWLGSLFILFAVVMIAHKNTNGWIMAIVGCVFFGVDACLHSTHHVLPIIIFLTGIAGWKYSVWSHKDRVELYLGKPLEKE